MSTPHGKAEHRRGRNHPVMLRRGPSPCSLNINPSFVHSTLILVPDTAETIKAEPTARNTTQNILFICTETWWEQWTSSSSERSSRSEAEREEAQPHRWQGVFRSWLVSQRIGTATEVSHASTRILLRLKLKGGKGFRNQAEDFGHSGTKHLRISGSTFLRLLDVGSSKLCPKTNQSV